MTREEHLLMVTMLGRQQLYIKLLIDVLKSREILSPGDLQAFESALRQDAASIDAVLRELRELYLNQARQLGVETGLTA
jgi:hypothetical protein